ncbi:FeoA family protein [Atopobiaceae bacterium 24-176]
MTVADKGCAREARIPLAEADVGTDYRFVSFEGLPEATARRLESVGMTCGTRLTVLNNKSRGTVIVRVRETRWAMGRTISSNILVAPAGPASAGSLVSEGPFVATSAGCAIGAPGTDGVATDERSFEGGEGR